MITHNDLISTLQLKAKTVGTGFPDSITGGYAGDLLSDVMANSNPGFLWITLQVHQNIVAVAALKELSGIILVNGREPDEETIRKAEEEHIFIATSTLPAFEIIGRMYELGIRGVL